MSDFDPDQYLAKKKAAPFDPDAYLKAKAAVVPVRDESGALPGDSVSPPAAQASQPDEISPGMTAVYRFGKGASMGLTPIFAGYAGALDEFGRRGRTALGLSGEGDVPVESEHLSLPDALAKRFRRERADYITDSERAAAANQKMAAATELAGALSVPLPGPNKLVAAKGLAGAAGRIGANAAMGTGIGLLSETAEEKPDYLTAGIGGGLIGATGGVVGEAFSGVGRSIASRAQHGIDAAKRTAEELAQKAADSLRSSAAGKLGGDANAVLNIAAKAKEALTDPLATEAVRQRAQAILAHPKVQAAIARAYENNFGRSAQKIGEMVSSEDALAAALKAATPEAVQNASAASLAEPIKKEIWPRVRKQLIDRFALPAAFGAAGSLIGDDDLKGGIGGAGVGFVTQSLIGGKPSTAFERMLNKPSVRKLGWEVLKKTLGEAPERLGRFAPTLTKALAAGPERFATVLFVLNGQDPEFRAKMNEIEAQ